MNNREFLETWYRRVWLEEDLSAIDDMMSDTAPVTGIGKIPHIGAADFKRFTDALLKLICDTKITIEDLMEDGEKISVLMHISAKCRTTGRPVDCGGIAHGQITDGKIVFAHNFVDFMSMFEQLGQLPKDTMARCLAGERLV